MKNKYDVIVVGAGPAGSVAAWYLAEKGLDVLLVEKDREIGVPVRCAEGIGNAGLREFIDPDPRWIAAEIKGARMVSPDGTKVELETLGMGFVLERTLFDKELAHQAGRHGAEISLRSCVTDLIIDDGVVNGVRLEKLGSIYDIECNIVIAADGVESRVGRWAGLKTHTSLHDMETNAQYLLGNVEAKGEYCEFYFGKAIAPGGYAWVFPKGDGKANVGLGISGDYSQEKTATEYLNIFIEKNFPDSYPLSFIVGGVPVSATLKKIATNGLMIAGDAARQVNPVSGGGIVNAMKGGREAAKVAVKAFELNDFSEKVLSEYEKNWENVQGKSHKRFYRLKEGISKLTDDSLNATANVLSSISPEKLTLFEVFKTALIKEPSLLLDIRHLFNIGI